MTASPTHHSGLVLLVATVLLVTARCSAHATTADDLCGPVDDPCIVATTVDVDADSDLDFGTRTLRLAPHGKLRFTGGLSISAGVCDLQVQSTLQQRTGTHGSVSLQCEAASLAGKIKLAAAETFEVLVATSLEVPGKIDVKGESIRIEMRSGANLEVAGKIQAAAQGDTALHGQLQIFLQGETGLSITAAASVVGKSFSGGVDGNELTLRAPLGQLQIDGKVQYTIPHALSFDGTTAQMHAYGDVRVGSHAKLTFRGGGNNSNSASGETGRLSIASLHGDVRIAGRLSVHARPPFERGGDVKITACLGDVRFEPGAEVGYASSDPLNLFPASADLSGLEVAGADTVTVDGTKLRGRYAKFWGITDASVASSSQLQLSNPVVVVAGPVAPTGYFGDYESPCQVVPPDVDVSFTCTATDEWDVVDPQFMATDSAGNVYVTSTTHYVHKFDAAGQLLLSWGGNGSGPGEFAGPYGIVVDASDTVYVADSSNDRIQYFDTSGAYGGEWAVGNPNEGQPYSLTLDQDGHVDMSHGAAGSGFVGDAIHKYTAAGTLVSSFGSFGPGTSELQQPQAIATRGSELYVVDFRNGDNQIKVYDLNGTFLRQWGAHGLAYGKLSEASGIAVDQVGDVYVADLERNRISKFTAAGQFLGACGTRGFGPGEFRIPIGITILPSGDLLVSDRDRVQVIQPF